MAERKVINKYIPPNFDPNVLDAHGGGGISGLGAGKRSNKTVRVMAPFSMQCDTCGEFIYKGRKFNARKETAHNEMYLGQIQVYRFYIKCPLCAAEICYKTDPGKADYAIERGAKRNFEPWREERREEEEAKTRRMLEELHNPMKALENKTFDSKRELQINEALDELRLRNARLERLGEIAELPEVVAVVDPQEEEDARLAREMFNQAQPSLSADNQLDEIEMLKAELDLKPVSLKRTAKSNPLGIIVKKPK